MKMVQFFIIVFFHSLFLSRTRIKYIKYLLSASLNTGLIFDTVFCYLLIYLSHHNTEDEHFSEMKSGQKKPSWSLYQLQYWTEAANLLFFASFLPSFLPSVERMMMFLPGVSCECASCAIQAIESNTRTFVGSCNLPMAGISSAPRAFRRVTSLFYKERLSELQTNFYLVKNLKLCKTKLQICKFFRLSFHSPRERDRGKKGSLNN